MCGKGGGYGAITEASKTCPMLLKQRWTNIFTKSYLPFANDLNIFQQ